MSKISALNSIVALAALLASGCSSMPRSTSATGGEPTPGTLSAYRSVDGKRYISGPYGNAHDIKSVIAIIEHHSIPEQVSVRGIDLSAIPPTSFISVYRYRFPTACGGSQFRVFKGDGTEILEYDDRQATGLSVQIRDYVRGPNPFIGPGLWGPFDSSSNAPNILLSGRAGKDGMGLMRGAYVIGWVTTLSRQQQKILGKSYRQAVHRAAQCGA